MGVMRGTAPLGLLPCLRSADNGVVKRIADVIPVSDLIDHVAPLREVFSPIFHAKNDTSNNKVRTL